MTPWFRSSALLALASLALAARAQTIDFEGGGDDFEGVQAYSGFRFTFTAGGFGVFTDDFGGGALVRNGTTRLEMNGGRDGQAATVLVEPLDGLPFSLLGLDAATSYPDRTLGSFEVVGDLVGGGTASRTFVSANAFASYGLPAEFGSLLRFRVRDLILDSTAGVSLDDIRIQAVPEPATMAALGLGTVATLRRRKRA